MAPIEYLLAWRMALAKRLLMLDARHMEWNSLQVRRDPGCPVCGEKA